MYLVTGGSDSSGYAISNTELLTQEDSSWIMLSGSGDLPQSRAALRSVSINNEIIVSGGNCACSIGATYDNIVKFDPSTLQWLQVDTMKQPRSNHGMSVVNVADIIEYCV